MISGLADEGSLRLRKDFLGCGGVAGAIEVYI